MASVVKSFSISQEREEHPTVVVEYLAGTARVIPSSLSWKFMVSIVSN